MSEVNNVRGFKEKSMKKGMDFLKMKCELEYKFSKVF
jgi:hypothetical protein